MTTDPKVTLPVLDPAPETTAARESVETAIETALTRERHATQAAQLRPGELPDQVMGVTTGDRFGAPAPGAVETVAGRGAVWTVTGVGIVASRDRFAVSSAPLALQLSYARSVDPLDPSGDTVRAMLVWLDKDGASLGTYEIASRTLTVADGWQSDAVIVGGADPAAIQPVADTAYVRPYLETFGTDGQTQIEEITVGGKVEARQIEWPVDHVIPATSAAALRLDHSVARTLFVSQGGDDANNGENETKPVRSIEAARDLAVTSGEPTLISVMPGIYETSGHIDIPDNVTGVMAVGNTRSTKIVPSAGNEVKNVFRLGDGGYVEGFSFEGFQVDDLDDPSEGFAISFRPGAIIRRTVFAFNITVYRPVPPSLLPPPLDRENGNPLVGNGPGVALADRAVASGHSPFPQIMLWGATPVCPNGIGYCAKNGAFLNGINAVALWMHKHYMALSGGEIILTNCASQFGDWTLVADGSRQEVVPASTTAPLVTDTGAADAVASASSAIVDQMWADLVAAGFSGHEASCRADGAALTRAIEYDLRTGAQESAQLFAKGLFNWNGVFTGDTVGVAASVFQTAHASIRDQIIALGGVGPAAQTMVTGLFGLVSDTISTPVLRTKPSKVTSVGHQWNNTMSGVNARGLSRPSLEVPDSILATNLGEVTAAGIDDRGKQYFSGGMVVNPLTGQLEGPPIGRTINPRARRAAMIAAGNTL